ncbi:MAG: PEP-CTERM sorting domain-containing protein [Pseudomonadota bacterium]
MTELSKNTSSRRNLSIVAKQTSLGVLTAATSLTAAGGAQAGLIEVIGPNTGGPLVVDKIASPVVETFSHFGVPISITKNGGAATIGKPAFKSKGFVGVFKTQFKGSNYVTTFDEGDSIGPGSGKFEDLAFFYIGETGPFSEEGDTDFIGLFVDVFGEEDDFFRYYGWAEVTRGSVVIERAFFQDESFEPALIPLSDPIDPPVDVPEPATLPLMALGAAGLMAMRRRKAA